MRIRALVASLAVVGVMFVGTAAPAMAAEAKKIPKVNEECIKKLEDASKTPDDCQKAPSAIAPATNELVWGIISFVVLFAALAKFAYPAMKKAIEDRSNKIRDSLDDAEKVRTEAQTILEDYQRQLADARNEANRIIEEARQTADQLRQDLMQRAEQEASELRQRTQEEMAAAQERMLSELRTHIRDLAIGAAEKVVERNLDRDTNLSLVDSYIESLSSGRA
ncbi:MAG: F0F1 ATP synthase subunit B [Actinobacteria bacterium]|nr:F0F1 ATP synthase subunit B [Actinomycetota bacterium]MBV9253505.1 F0F1 ATP synthase subunit B [Actinomycetota bacterium]